MLARALMVEATLEPNEHNQDGSAVTVYLKRLPSHDELKAIFKGITDLPLKVDTNDVNYSGELLQNNLSEFAGLYRFQGFPTA